MKIKKILQRENTMAVYFQKREVVVPGQLLAEGRYRPSYGTYDENGKIYSTLVGLAELRGNTVKVVALEGAYIPKEGDLVIGIITTSVAPMVRRCMRIMLSDDHIPMIFQNTWILVMSSRLKS